MSLPGRLKRLVPPTLRRQYHHLLALAASVVYGQPSRHLIVVAVTGTDGKTTTASLIADVLRSSGAKVGLSSSAIFQVGDQRWLNESHLTMPGRFKLHKLLRQMVTAGCRYAVIEVSSEGLTQYRQAGIDVDVAVITNVTPEHIEAHGTFEAYRQTKGLLFSSIIRGGDKHLFGQVIPKVTVVNLDDPSHDYFLKFWAEHHFGTTLQDHQGKTAVGEKLTVIAGREAQPSVLGMQFAVDGQQCELPLPGEYNVRNALQAIAVGRALGIGWSTIRNGLARANSIPGRAQSVITRKPWRVMVDYALTPAALEQFYRSLQADGAQRIIAVFGAAGGGRDTWKRPELGKIAAAFCDQIILTTDDPYDEDPAYIAAAISAGIPAEHAHKVEIILDRREAIKQAMSEAQAGDVIAITGMGSETSMMVRGQQVEWSDAKVVKELLADSKKHPASFDDGVKQIMTDSVDEAGE